jgi:hypothetical protein
VYARDRQVVHELERASKSVLYAAKAQVLKWARTCVRSRANPRGIEQEVIELFRGITLQWVTRRLRKNGPLWQRAVTWYRIRAEQWVSLLLLAESFCVRPTQDAESEQLHFLDLPGGLLRKKITLRAPPSEGFHCYVSAHNAGAAEIAHDELRPLFHATTPLRIAYSPAQLPILKAARLRDDAYPGAAVFLLYLDGRTWTSRGAARLEAEVMAALRSGLPIMCELAPSQTRWTLCVC